VGCVGHDAKGRDVVGDVVDVDEDVNGWRRNPRYDRVDAVLRETPGVWRKVRDVGEKRDAQRWREAGKRRGWLVRERRTDVGWSVYAQVPDTTQGETR